MSNPTVIGHAEGQQRISERIDRLPRPIEVLEAGCGRRWTLDLEPPYRLTGVDLDGEALRARTEQQGDLDEGIVGDLRTVELPDAGFDVIYCSFVLEHVHGAEDVLRNFDRWLRPGGLLVLKVPDRDALYGLGARLTPHRLHVWYYRYVRGQRQAGTVGHGPYPTVYDEVISKPGFAAFCARQGLVIEETHHVDNYIRGSRAMRTIGRLAGLVTLGRLPWRWNDLTFVARKGQ